MRSVYLLNSDRWLHDEILRHGQAASSDWSWAETPEEADLIIYLDPPAGDPGAPETLRTLRVRDLRKLYAFSQHDTAIAWWPGMYAGLPKSDADPLAHTGSFYIRQSHRDPARLRNHLAVEATTSPDLLWSFMGTVRNSPVRRKIQALADERGLVIDTDHFNRVVRHGWQDSHRDAAQKAFSDYAATLRRAKFVLCPRGLSPSSVRLFEAMQVGRCPVIISDEWLPPRFVNWETCSIRVAENAVARIPSILRDHEARADELGACARKEWAAHFSEEHALSTIVRTCLAIDDRIGNRLGRRMFVAVRAATTGRALRNSTRPLRHWILGASRR